MLNSCCISTFLLSTWSTYWYFSLVIDQKITGRRFKKKQRARSIQPKFPGWSSKISWCRMDRDWSEQPRSIYSTRTTSFALIWMEDVGSLLVLDLDDDFDGDINDIVWGVSRVVLSITLSGPFPDICRMTQILLLNDKKNRSKFSREINRLEKPLTVKRYTCLAKQL